MWVSKWYPPLNSTWSYENRVSKHFVIFRNFPCLWAWDMFTVLVAYVAFFFWLVLWLGIRVEVDVDWINILPPLPIFFFPKCLWKSNKIITQAYHSRCTKNYQVRQKSLQTFQPSYASSRVKNENDAIRNRISDFDKRRISQPKTQFTN